MQQRISIENLRELNYNQAKKLLELWKPLVGDLLFDYDKGQGLIIHLKEDKNLNFATIHWCKYNDSTISELKTEKMILPLLTIGQMMELLYNCHTNILVEYGVEGFFAKIKAGVSNKQVNEELSEALWLATKKMLDVMIKIER